MINNEVLMEAQSKIAEALKNESIPYAVLKGTSLSACYYDPFARALGDIDLLVPVQFVDRASEVLISQGFCAPEDSFAHPYHIDFYKNSVVAELHDAVSTFPDSPARNRSKTIYGVMARATQTKAYRKLYLQLSFGLPSGIELTPSYGAAHDNRMYWTASIV